MIKVIHDGKPVITFHDFSSDDEDEILGRIRDAAVEWANQPPDTVAIVAHVPSDVFERMGETCDGVFVSSTEVLEGRDEYLALSEAKAMFESVTVS